MAIGSGLAGSFGIVDESTYGTYVAPTRWYEATGNIDFKKVKNTYQGGGLAAGRFAQPGSMRVVTTVAGVGAVPLEVRNTKMGLLLKHIFGSTPTPTLQNTSTGYLQSHVLADNFGKSFTAQVGVPDTTGTVRPYTFLGAKITAAEFSCRVNEGLTVALDIDFRDVSEAQGLVAPSYTTGQKPFHFGQWSPKIHATYGSEALVQGVRSFTLKIERPQDGDRFYGGNGGLKSEPIWNDYVKVSGAVEVDYQTKGDFADRFASDTPVAMLHEFLGASLGGSPTINETFRIRTSQTFFDGETPTVQGPGIVTTSFPFTCQNDLTNPIVAVDYISTDATL